MDPNDVEPLIPDGLYDPSEVVLIGSHMEPSPEVKPTETVDESHMQQADLDNLRSGHMLVRSDFARMLKLEAVPTIIQDENGKDTETHPTIALIYAYGYEGHTYRLPKPRIMIVPGAGKPFVSSRDRDPTPMLTGKLFMWRCSKHHQTISIEVESGELKTLMLEANQPGNRAVNSYAAHMQMSHRGGKLS